MPFSALNYNKILLFHNCLLLGDCTMDPMKAVLFIFVLLLGNIEVLQGQSTATGRVFNAETGKPLRGAHIFLSGTKIGTTTDSSGQYHLQEIPPGGYRLVVSIIGYERVSNEILFDPDQIKKIDFKLSPVIYELPDIYVGNLDKKWKKHLRRFKELFFGMSKTADSVKILNPEVLRFKTRWWGRLKAEALAPLQIENRALGYHITYYLDEFEHSGTTTKWDGNPLFSEMTPSDSLQAVYWEQNRRKAFYGSLRHFLLALLQDRVKEEGFIVHRFVQDVYGYSPQNKFSVNPRRLTKESDKSYLYHFNFMGRLQIIYVRDEEDPRYVRWMRNLQRGPANVQTSYLELNERPITIDPDGEILEPYGATQLGYFAFQRLADATPREFRPKKYFSSFNQLNQPR